MSVMEGKRDTAWEAKKTVSTPKEPVNSKEFPYTKGVTDIAVQVENTVFHVNRWVLMVASPVFMKMFTSDFKEKGAKKITLEQKNAEDFALFLKFIHPSHMVTFDDNSVPKLLPLASEYMVQPLTKRCEEYLLKSFIPKAKISDLGLEKLMSLMNFSELYNLGNLQKKSVKLLAKKDYKSVEEHELYEELSVTTQNAILRERVRFVETGVQSFLKQYAMCTCFRCTCCSAENWNTSTPLTAHPKCSFSFKQQSVNGDFSSLSNI